ncbi:tetratricopeptide repeat protein [Deinococcus knuensis]|uniref:tetratricopeptide repeat protein n=1 Tax=Deinococcus knuensis TaxID=1837380 RepID=UPI00166D0277|nr:tetratricopeptide repeat protein [Deinococcus knuensis]
MNQRTIPFPWPLAVLAAALALPATQAVRDLRADRLLTQSRAQQQALEVDQAIDSQRAAVTINPRDARLQEALAESARTLWFFRRTDALKAEADAAFAAAKRLSPSWPVPHYEHARMYAFREDYARGLTLLQGAIDRDPNNAAYWLERARYLDLSGQTQQARGAYERCLTLNSGVGECRDGLKALEGRP